MNNTHTHSFPLTNTLAMSSRPPFVSIFWTTSSAVSPSKTSTATSRRAKRRRVSHEVDLLRFNPRLSLTSPTATLDAPANRVEPLPHSKISYNVVQLKRPGRSERRQKESSLVVDRIAL